MKVRRRLASAHQHRRSPERSALRPNTEPLPPSRVSRQIIQLNDSFASYDPKPATYSLRPAAFLVLERQVVGNLEMTEPSTGAKTPPSRSSSGETRLNEHQQTEVPQEKSGFSAGHHHITRTVSHKSVPVTYFAGDGELQREVTRQDTGISTHTQDPNADDFDFEQHLRHILRKADKEGVKRRDLGGQSSFCFCSWPAPLVPRSARTFADPVLPTSP